MIVVTLTVTDADAEIATYSRTITVSPLDEDPIVEEPPPKIPGYDIYILIGGIIISTLILTKMKYKQKKK